MNDPPKQTTAVDAPTVLFMTFINFELDFSCSDNVSEIKHIWITIYIQQPNVLHEFLAKTINNFSLLSNAVASDVLDRP